MKPYLSVFHACISELRPVTGFLLNPSNSMRFPSIFRRPPAEFRRPLAEACIRKPTAALRRRRRRRRRDWRRAGVSRRVGAWERAASWKPPLESWGGERPVHLPISSPALAVRREKQEGKLGQGVTLICLGFHVYVYVQHHFIRLFGTSTYYIISIYHF